MFTGAVWTDEAIATENLGLEPPPSRGALSLSPPWF
jgi:hypothetical protein